MQSGTQSMRSSKGRGLTARRADGQAARWENYLFRKSALSSRRADCNVFSSVVADLFYVRADLFSAGAIAPIFSQLLIIPAQLLAILFDFIARIANIFEILSNLGLVMMPTVVMTNFAPEVMPVISSVMIRSASVIAVPSPMIALPLSMLIVFPEVRIFLSVLCVSCRRCSRDN